MEIRLSNLILVCLGLVCDFLVFLVDSQSQNVPASPVLVRSSPPPPPPSPPPPSPPPPPPSPPPPSPPPPPPPSPPPPPPPAHSPPPPPPPPSPLPPPSSSPPPPSLLPPTMPPRPSLNPPTTADETTSTTSDQSMNAGKKIGLLFVGIAIILQIGVAGFLVFKRRQLLRIKDRYEQCSS